MLTLGCLRMSKVWVYLRRPTASKVEHQATTNHPVVDTSGRDLLEHVKQTVVDLNPRIQWRTTHVMTRCDILGVSVNRTS